MENTKNYRVLHSNTSDSLEDLVSSSIAEGFEPHGNLIMFQSKDGTLNFLQAVKKLPKKAWTGGSKKQVLPIIGKCPLCGGNLTYSEKGMIKCDNASCNTGFYQYYGRSISKEEATKLFAGESIILDNIPQKDGSKISRKVKLSEKTSKTEKINWFTLEVVQ